jgi:Mu-like prophage I protein
VTAGLRSLMRLQRSQRVRICAKASRRSGGEVRAYAFQASEAPPEIKLWNAGDNPTDYGVHRWTPRSAELVMQRYEARGNPIQIDVDHNYSGEEVPVDGTLPTGGYARLELRAGEPWLIFDWSAYGLEQIGTRQRLFLSPEYDVDKGTGEILALYRVSLVGDPATHNARQLAMRIRASTETGEKNMRSAFQMMHAALTAANSHEDPETCKSNVAALLGEYAKAMSPGEGEKPEGEGKDKDKQETAVEERPARPPEEVGASAETEGDKDKSKDKEAEDEKAKAARAAAAAKRIAGDGATAPVLALAQKVATELLERDQTIADLTAKDAARDKRERELEASERVSAAGDKIPEALRAFARGLSRADFDVFVKGLPEPKPGATQQKRVNAAGRPAHGSNSGTGPVRPEGDLDPENKRVLARVFNLEERPEEPVTILPDGRLRLTCLARKKPTPPSGGREGGGR